MADYFSNPPANRLTNLLNKTERQLGLSFIPLPDSLKKDTWPEILQDTTLPTFSRYFPNGYTTTIRPDCYRNGWYYIDQNVPKGSIILGVSDLDWQEYRVEPSYGRYGINFSTYDFMSREYNMDDVAFSQMSADICSLFDNSIYIEYKAPNKVRLVSVQGAPVSQHAPFPLKIFLQHDINLMTISPTMMEAFERLAKSDIAMAVYQYLKFYDSTDTTYATIDLKLDTIREWAEKREDIVKELEEAHVSTANEFQPIMMTV